MFIIFNLNNDKNILIAWIKFCRFVPKDTKSQKDMYTKRLLVVGLLTILFTMSASAADSTKSKEPTNIEIKQVQESSETIITTADDKSSDSDVKQPTVNKTVAKKNESDESDESNTFAYATTFSIIAFLLLL
jgi:hypothetical protein